MSDPQERQLLKIYLTEYEKLKDEQSTRIGFRDNLIYATLVAIGGVLSFTLANTNSILALLVLPLATVVLGRVYVANDEKISSIGRYIREDLAARIGAILGAPREQIFAWERDHRARTHPARNKTFQLVVELALFVGTGIVALVALIRFTATISLPLALIIVVELALLGVLTLQIFTQARTG